MFYVKKIWKLIYSLLFESTVKVAKAGYKRGRLD